MNRVRHFLVALFVVTSALALWRAPLAHAGSLQVRDTASVLSSSDRSQIEAAASRYPFDVRVLTSTAYADQPAFSRYVGSQVNEANEVVVGLDPVHHHTQVHFGTAAHIPQGEWSAIERAGNAKFRDGDWAGGITAVLDSASANVSRAGVVAPETSSSHSGAGIAGGLMLLFVIGIPVLIIVGIVMAIRRFAGGNRMGGGYAGPGYGAPGPGYGGPGYGGPGYGGPGYGGGYPGGGGMGAVGGGLIGAGLGGVAGYELGKLEGERERGGGGGSYEGVGPSERDDGGSFDAGGGGSDWDGGGDGGGGGDFGGGGDSGGGGGSDW